MEGKQIKNEDDETSIYVLRIGSSTFILFQIINCNTYKVNFLYFYFA